MGIYSSYNFSASLQSKDVDRFQYYKSVLSFHKVEIK